MRKSPEQALGAIDVESCGKSRILLNGAVQDLHHQNVLVLAQQRRELVRANCKVKFHSEPFFEEGSIMSDTTYLTPEGAEELKARTGTGW